VSLANDFVGYLPTDEILDQGAYEADICPCRPIESALTEHTVRVLAKAFVIRRGLCRIPRF